MPRRHSLHEVDSNGPQQNPITIGFNSWDPANASHASTNAPGHWRETAALDILPAAMPATAEGGICGVVTVDLEA